MFCLKCGKKIADDAKFCPECGAATELGEKASTSAQEPRAQAEGARKTTPVALENVEYAILGATTAIGVIAVVTMVTGASPLIVLIDTGLSFLIYRLVYRNLKEGKPEIAKRGSLIMGVICGAGGLLTALAGDNTGLLGMSASAALFYAFAKL